MIIHKSGLIVLFCCEQSPDSENYAIELKNTGHIDFAKWDLEKLKKQAIKILSDL